MLCPRCGNNIVHEHVPCSACGFDPAVAKEFDRIRFFVQQTRRTVDDAQKQIRNLEDHVNRLTPMLADRLAAPRPAETPATKPSQPPAETPAVVAAESDARPLLDFSGEQEADGEYEQAEVLPSAGAEIRLGQKWLLIVGVIATVLSAAYFLKYSFDRNWIGPEGRVLLSFLGAVSAIGAGEWFRRQGFAVFGLYLIGGGTAVLYFTGFAAAQLYQLVSQESAFVYMAGVTGGAAWMAIRHDSKWLAVLGIVGGFATPVILRTGTDRQIALMTYLAVLNGGVFWIAIFRRWGLLNSLGFLFTWLLFGGWYYSYYNPDRFWITMLFLQVFFLTYAVGPFVYHLAHPQAHRQASFALTIPNSALALLYGWVMIRGYAAGEYLAVVTVAYAALFFGLAAVLYRRQQVLSEPFVLLVGKSISFLILTIPVLFSRHWITAFWALQGVVLLWAAIGIRDRRLLYGGSALLFASLVKLYALDYALIFGFDFSRWIFTGGFGATWPARWTTLAVIFSALFRAGQLLRAPFPRESSALRWFGPLCDALTLVLLFWTLNIEVIGYVCETAPAFRFAAVSVLWGVCATGLMVAGFVLGESMLRWSSMLLFGVTAVKVFVSDVSHVRTPYRILSFLVLGVLLIGASYLYHRYRGRIEPGGTAESVRPGR